MIKQSFILLGLTFAFIPQQNVMVESAPKVEDLYVTTEDIVLDLIMPIIDKRVIKEYGGGPLFDWQIQRIVGIAYNDDHSYDVSVRINIPSGNDNTKEDLVKVRVSPSCDSGKINKQVCNHDFRVEIVEYKHLSK
ncbi:hypothetical protein [Litchfieldia alkalitelluris]|uniref:hypothetical protein n=1 Tax=Litchfieldia alkalitelluris TaxID=304268 RepID=UPI000996AD17|nr:hypothetical protein [Litchfieldia alkalitelluris]